MLNYCIIGLIIFLAFAIYWDWKSITNYKKLNCFTYQECESKVCEYLKITDNQLINIYFKKDYIKVVYYPILMVPEVETLEIYYTNINGGN